MTDLPVEIHELLHQLDSHYSRAQWFDRGDGTGDVRVDYFEGGERVFSVHLKGVTEKNRELASYIARGLSGALDRAYASSVEDHGESPSEPGPPAIVSSRGFFFACVNELSRYQSLAPAQGLTLELEEA